jgi:hypothetical protein
MHPEITAELKQWASAQQALYVDAVIAAGGRIPRAAQSLGVHRNTVLSSLNTLKARAAAHGWSPEHGMTRAVPTPFVAKGHSTLDRINPLTGERTQVLQWTKTRLDDEAWAEQIKSGVAAFIADQPKIVIKPRDLGKTHLDADIIPWIQIGDAHLGMLAHEAESGANFDLKIAEVELCTAIAMLIDELPMTERLVIQDVGDFTHYENMAGVTEASGHALDYDGRFPKMIDVYARVMRFIVDKALEKARNVDVIINQGNHSRTNDIWMAVLLREVYAPTGRVNVLNNHSPFIAYRMGNTLVMCHHSDKCRPHQLAQVMTTDFKVDWGETDYHYIDIGHIHHNMVLKEHPGVVIESWNQLAAKDKWAADGGYRSRQSISMVFRSRTYGEVGRRLLPLRQVQDRIRATAHGAKHYVAPVQRAYTV